MRGLALRSSSRVVATDFDAHEGAKPVQLTCLTRADTFAWFAHRRRDVVLGSPGSNQRRYTEPSIRLHREIGPGLLESVYETVLAGKLIEMESPVDRQMSIDIELEGRQFEAAFRTDSARRSTRAGGN
jgi:hypothetical protein